MNPSVATMLEPAPWPMPTIVWPLGQPPAQRAPARTSRPPPKSSTAFAATEPRISLSSWPNASVGESCPASPAAMRPPNGRQAPVLAVLLRAEEREPRAQRTGDTVAGRDTERLAQEPRQKGDDETDGRTRDPPRPRRDEQRLIHGSPSRSRPTPSRP